MASRRVTSPTFVGRATELGVLDAALARAGDGLPAFVFIAGESGVGKTRLLREFESRATSAGARMLLGQCLDLGGAQIPYAPLVGALRAIGRSDEPGRLPEGVRNALAELLPELGGTSPGRIADEEHRLRQGRLFEAMLTLIEQLGRSGPVLLAIEDFHWADGSTRDFITFLVRSAREEPLCLVVTYRSDELHRRHPVRPVLTELERAAGVERLSLERFSRSEVAEQLAGILQEPAPKALAERLYSRSEGNALYTEELLASTEDGGGWLLPETLRDALLARVERLGPATHEVVRIAAVLDRPVTHGLLEAVSRLTPTELMEGAREAVAHQVLVADARGMYAFRHALVGEAVHGDLLPGEDTALHRRIATVLEERPELLGEVSADTVAAELACHWRAAHELDRALGASVRAGIAAKRVFAYEEAQKQFERALELWDRVPDAEQRAGMDRSEVLRHAATCANGRGEEGRAVALIREALTGIDEQAEPLRAASLYERLGHFQRAAGESDDSFASFDRALALLPPEPSSERARVLETRARTLMLRGEFTRAVEAAHDALQDARAVGAELTEARALNTLGFSRAGLGEEAEGIATLRQAHARAREIAAPGDQSRSAINLSEVLDLSGRTEEALAVVRAEIAEARLQVERTSFAAFMVLQEVNFLVRLGRLAEARERMPRRVPGEAISYTVMFWRDQRARIALLTGDFVALREELGALQQLRPQAVEPQWVEPRIEMEAELAVREDRLDDARDALLSGAPLIEQSDEATRLMRLAWVARRVEAEIAGRAQALGEPYTPALDELAERLRDRACQRPRFDEACAFDAMGKGELTRRRTLLGEAPADATPWLGAADAFDAIALPIPAAYARLRAAEALVTAGDRGGAAVPLSAAAASAAATGASLIAGDIQALARRARIELEGAPEPALEDREDSPVARLGLTPRELEVLLLVAEGRTNRLIGETLFMSEKTASVHVSRILAKLGVGGRVEAAAVAHRLGLSGVQTP